MTKDPPPRELTEVSPPSLCWTICAMLVTADTRNQGVLLTS